MKLAQSSRKNNQKSIAKVQRLRSPKPSSSDNSSADRLIALLTMFSVEEPEWTVEAAARRLGMSSPTAYRYFRSLARAGLISPSSRASYVLGPAIIEMDREIRMCDPMLRAARSVMEDLIQYAAEGSTILLCRVFRDRIICIHQVVGPGRQGPVSYERGRPMPLLRGATAKIVLANLPARSLRNLYAEQAKAIKAAGLGDTWQAFRTALSALRRAGFCITRGEVDPGRVGVAAPIYDGSGVILGSLSFVLPAPRATRALLGRLAPLTVACAREIERAMADHENAADETAQKRLAR